MRNRLHCDRDALYILISFACNESVSVVLIIRVGVTFGHLSG